MMAPSKSKLPPSLKKQIKILQRLPSQKQCLTAAHKIVTDRFYGSRALTYLAFWRLFWSVDRAWNHSGFLQCTGQNKILSLLLIESKKFSAKDIKPVWTTCWLVSPHQYLNVRVGGKWIAVDPWAFHVEKKSIGEHAGI